MNSRPSRSEISRVLSHALRHAPGEYGLALDPQGWAPVTELLRALHRLGQEWELVDETTIREVLEASKKKRHQMAEGRIRALHGHSIPVQALYEPTPPPPVLFHGTARATVPAIRVSGILPMQRQYVHLAETVEQARQVGVRKDLNPAILTVDTGVATASGVLFYRPESGIWLATSIPASAVGIPGVIPTDVNAVDK
ncbi:RNA 2'-phosphotransferase [Arthrobacter globiformis]|uniref:RNA 2'-phosphotransferase n=1 Tax=Arthrobacter globiformis TaxID=1665 RepID=UPI00359335B0